VPDAGKPSTSAEEAPVELTPIQSIQKDRIQIQFNQFRFELIESRFKIQTLRRLVVVVVVLRPSCCENDKEHSELVGHHLLDCLLDAMYDPYIPTSCQ
jgi:hypothetical protein